MNYHGPFPLKTDRSEYAQPPFLPPDPNGKKTGWMERIFGVVVIICLLVLAAGPDLWSLIF